jgi:hypothetical protein
MPGHAKIKFFTSTASLQMRQTRIILQTQLVTEVSHRAAALLAEARFQTSMRRKGSRL